jgi:hypothetical protein
MLAHVDVDVLLIEILPKIEPNRIKGKRSSTHVGT